MILLTNNLTDTPYRLEKELGFSRYNFTRWKKSIPNHASLFIASNIKKTNKEVLKLINSMDRKEPFYMMIEHQLKNNKKLSELFL